MLPDGQSADLAVVDALGRAVLTERVSDSVDLDLDLGRLAPGPYLVRLTTGSEAVSTRLMVAR